MSKSFVSISLPVGLTLSLVTPLRDLSPEDAHAETCQRVSKPTWALIFCCRFVLNAVKMQPEVERSNTFAPGLCWKSSRTRVRRIFLSLLWSFRELIFKPTGPISDGGWCTKLICIMFPLVLEHSWCKSALMMHSGLSENHYHGWVWRITHKHFMLKVLESWLEFANCNLFLGIHLLLLFTARPPNHWGRGGAGTCLQSEGERWEYIWQ